MKNLVVLLFISAIVGGGIGYVVYTDPERESLTMFEDALEAFSNDAQTFEISYNKESSLPIQQKKLILKYLDSNKIEHDVVVNMVSNGEIVSLVFSEGDWPLSSQSIVLEPFIPEKNDGTVEIRWKCISGSVLIRQRTKNCRLGYGILTSELRNKK